MEASRYVDAGTAAPPVSATGDQPVALPEPPPKKHRSPWISVSGALALAAVGLLIWGVSTLRADLNSSKDDVSDLQTQVSNESTA